jgi:F-type H+-transporting ATPase subunit 8
MAAMPQLIPFYFVNEVVTGYAAVLIVCYLLTKYWLPQTVRSRLARLFVSKL